MANLLKLGFEISERTVSRYLLRRKAVARILGQSNLEASEDRSAMCGLRNSEILEATIPNAFASHSHIVSTSHPSFRNRFSLARSRRWFSFSLGRQY